MIEYLSFCRLQIACFAVLIYVGILFIVTGKGTKCNPFADKLFFLSEIAVVFDAVTAYSVNNLDKMPFGLNIVFHGIFYILLQLIVFCLFMYLLSITESLPKTMLAKCIIFGSLLIMLALTIAFLPQIKIAYGDTSNYSYGPPVYITYSSMPILIVLSVIYCLRYRKQFNRLKMWTYISCLAGAFLLSLLQFLVPEVLCTSLTVSYISISVVLNAENPVNYRLAMFIEKSKMEKCYYDRLDEIEQKQSLIRHDEKHYLAALAGLCAEGKIEEIEKLLKVMDVELQKNTPRKWVHNRIVNALFNEKELIARKQGVTIDFEIEPDIVFPSVKDIDLISMFGNLIDNAVRAEHDLSDSTKKVNVRLFETDGNFIMFTVENHYKNVVVKGGRIVSTKKSAGIHGLGLVSVRSVTERYGGLLDLNYDGEVFVASISLPKHV